MQVKDRNRSARSIATLAIVSLVLQLGFAPSLVLGQGHPNFAFIFVGIIALSIGGRTAVTCGFFAGLLFDLSSTGPVGLCSLLFSLAAYILGIELRDRVSEEPMMTLIPFSVATLCVALCYNISMVAFGASNSLLEALVFRALPTTLLTVLCYLPYLFIVSLAHGGSQRPNTPMKSRNRYTLGNR